MIAYRAASFKRLDRNGAGYLTGDDIPAFLTHPHSELDFDRMTKMFGTDHDGRVSYDEFVHGPTPHFDFADANHDRVVTAAELRAAMSAAKH